MMERVDITGQAGNSSDPRPGRATAPMRPCIWLISDLLALAWRNGQRTLEQPRFRRAYADLELGLHSRRRTNPNGLRQGCVGAFDIRPLPCAWTRMRSVGNINENACNHRPERQVDISFKAAVSACPPRGHPGERPRCRRLRAAHRVTAAGKRGFATEGPYLESDRPAGPLILGRVISKQPTSR